MPSKTNVPFKPQNEFWTWANKTLDAYAEEHQNHDKAYHANCRICLIRAVKHRRISPKARRLFQSVLTVKSMYYINSVIREYNLAENGIDFVELLPEGDLMQSGESLILRQDYYPELRFAYGLT